MLAAVSSATIVLLAASVSAMPNLHPRETVTLSPWVTVGDDGTPKTVTPVLTTISGTPTIISAAPIELTGTVFTETNYGEVTTSTGTAPAPTATASDGAGSFLSCSNKDGVNAPFCQPTEGENLYPGTTYYLLWDTSYFGTDNTTIMVQGNYFNETTGATDSQAFTSERMAASWGFWSLTVDSALMQGSSSKNISLQIAALNASGSASRQIIKGPTVLVTNKPTYHKEPTKLPSGAGLYIGIPAVFAFIVVCVLGTFLWNRKHRKINLGNVMSRSRHGYGIGKSARTRMGTGKSSKDKKAAERVQLMEREIAVNGGQVYHDEPGGLGIGIPRRDSDALGSLAGTPTEERRMEFHRPGTREEGDRSASAADGERNLFRDELSRQNDERL
ncbi:hypothetical protein BJ170DRAFT_152220 [Xylariales sp. AK1849]|nr:hypothetical protein BJ170DRAFT_152220 [Xylariales sp. AK1849]